MSTQLVELERVLEQLIAEHRKLLAHVEAQQAAMRKLDLKTIEQTSSLQEMTRVRIGALEQRRKLAVAQLALSLRMAGTPTLAALAEAMPAARSRLLALREQLRDLAGQVAARARVAGRVAGAVLGHLNTAMRLLAGAMEQAGLYTKHGVPKVSARIGVMEAVA
jgi:hypothetical protein